MKLKIKIKLKYKGFIYYQPKLECLTTPAKIIKPVFLNPHKLLPGHAIARA
jgi:hypothetical protein